MGKSWVDISDVPKFLNLDPADGRFDWMVRGIPPIDACFSGVEKLLLNGEYHRGDFDRLDLPDTYNEFRSKLEDRVIRVLQHSHSSIKYLDLYSFDVSLIQHIPLLPRLKHCYFYWCDISVFQKVSTSAPN